MFSFYSVNLIIGYFVLSFFILLSPFLLNQRRVWRVVPRSLRRLRVVDACSNSYTGCREEPVVSSSFERGNCLNGWPKYPWSLDSVKESLVKEKNRTTTRSETYLVDGREIIRG